MPLAVARLLFVEVEAAAFSEEEAGEEDDAGDTTAAFCCGPINGAPLPLVDGAGDEEADEAAGEEEDSAMIDEVVEDTKEEEEVAVAETGVREVSEEPSPAVVELVEECEAGAAAATIAALSDCFPAAEESIKFAFAFAA